MQRLTRWLCFLAMLGFLSACTEDSPGEISFKKRDIPDEVFTDFVTQESKGGRLLWKLSAPRADRFIKRKLIVLDRPQIEFFNQDGDPRTTLVSDAGEYSAETHDMLAYGHVVVRSVDGEVLETDSLLWNSESNMISSESFVTLTRGNDVITGYGLECDPNFTSVDIKRDVRATIVEPNGGEKK